MALQVCYLTSDIVIQGLTNFSVILKYAGADATVAYDSVHAPGLIEDTLPQSQCLGPLDPTTKFTERPEESSGIVMNSVAELDKPHLHKFISVQDFESHAAATFTPKAWAFYSSAATDLITHTANRTFFRRLMFRPRVMRNVKDVITKRSILGFESELPFFISPAAMAKLAHPDGELALSRGAGAEGIPYCVSGR